MGKMDLKQSFQFYPSGFKCLEATAYQLAPFVVSDEIAAYLFALEDRIHFQDRRDALGWGT